MPDHEHGDVDVCVECLDHVEYVVAVIHDEHGEPIVLDAWWSHERPSDHEAVLSG